MDLSLKARGQWFIETQGDSMKKIFVIFAIVAISLFTQHSYAGIMIEPYLGYAAGTVDTKDTNDVSVSNAQAASTYGLRLGAKVLMAWLALDYMASNGTATPNDSSAKFDFSTTSLGATAGVNLILGLRLFAGYGFSNDLTLKKTAGDVSAKGTYTKAGIGISPIPFLSFNLEYIMSKYSKVNIGTGKGLEELATNYKSFDNNTLMATVSIPL
jgi:hypothetical protein